MTNWTTDLIERTQRKPVKAADGQLFLFCRQGNGSWSLGHTDGAEIIAGTGLYRMTDCLVMGVGALEIRAHLNAMKAEAVTR